MPSTFLPGAFLDLVPHLSFCHELTSSRYGLCLATSIMLYMVAKKPASGIARRAQASKNS